jgi:predicted RNase H-like HicB family nuclease
MFVALCPELDIASQGTTVEEAKTNLKEAVELFFELASSSEIKSRHTSINNPSIRITERAIFD